MFMCNSLEIHMRDSRSCINYFSLASNINNLLQIPNTHYEKVWRQSFLSLWNELPDNIKAVDNVQKFKTQRKTLLFRKQKFI